MRKGGRSGIEGGRVGEVERSVERRKKERQRRTKGEKRRLEIGGRGGATRASGKPKELRQGRGRTR